MTHAFALSAMTGQVLFILNIFVLFVDQMIFLG
jgi:hypothetical protein